MHLHYMEKKKVTNALHFDIVIKKVKHNSIYVYNEYVDWRDDMIKDMVTKEQKRKNDVKAKAFFPRRSSTRKKIVCTEALKCTILTGTSASRSFSLIAARSTKNKKVAITFPLYSSINITWQFFLQQKKINYLLLL